MATDFVVVGGGIGGAALAGLLGRGGKKVVVLEKSLVAPRLVRPEMLWPGTVELLFSLRPKEFWEREAVLAMRGVEFQNGERTLPFITADVLRDARVQPWFTDPNQTREQLLRLGSFELRRGVEVIAILKEKSRIVGVRTRDTATREEGEVLARYTVGDDGAQSLVRKACGIEMETLAFPVEFLCFGCDWPAAVPSVEASWNQFCAADPTMREVTRNRRFPAGFVRVRRPWGHAPRYGAEGAILMGDAAHPVSPASGQGANMSVADAPVLAELALGNHGDLLAEYERRRRPANARSISLTRTMALALSLPQRLLPFTAFLSIMRLVAARYPSLVRRFLRSASTMFDERVA